MNELINQASIDSYQIAEMLDSRHDKVKQSIERLASDNKQRKAVIALPPMGIVQTTVNNRTYGTDVYIFSGEQGKRDSIIVVAQLSPEFTAALVDRWQELENGVVKPAFQIPQTLGEALQLAANQALQIEQDAPKVNAYDKLIDSKNLKSVGDVAKSIGLRSAQALNKKLETVNAYDGRCANRVWSGWFIEQGLGEMKTTDDGYSSNKMTAKGQAWALDLFGGAK